jgi:hypothetical protein
VMLGPQADNNKPPTKIATQALLVVADDLQRSTRGPQARGCSRRR